MDEAASSLGARLRADESFHDAEVITYPDAHHLLAVVVPQGFRAAPELRQRILDVAALPDGDIGMAVVGQVPRRADGHLDLDAVWRKIGGEANVCRFVAPRTETEKLLVDLVTTISPGVRVSVTDSLGDLGVDSIGVFELAAAIAERTGATLTLESLYAGESLRTLAAQITDGG